LIPNRSAAFSTQPPNQTAVNAFEACGLDSGLPSYLGHQKIRNEVANLPQQIQFRRGWNVFVFYFRPCRVAGLSKTFQLFLKSCGMAVINYQNGVSFYIYNSTTDWWLDFSSGTGALRSPDGCGEGLVCRCHPTS